MKHSGHRALQRGFTLVELVVVIAGIALIAAAGALSMSGIHGRTANQKLRGDLVTINKAVRMYQLNGGDWATFTTTAASSPGDAIDILKRKASDASAKKLAGFTGQFIDQRLKPVMQTAAEAATTQQRILWDVTTTRFVIATSGARGIKRVDMITDAGELEASGGTEERTGPMKLAATDKWVWDYTDRTWAGGEAPTGVNTYLGTNPAILPDAPPALTPPSFSVPTGNNPLFTYPLMISLINPNDPAVSEIIYSINGSGWMFYGGTPIETHPEDELRAFAQSTVVEDWRNSLENGGKYTTTPVTLEMEFVGPAMVNYAEVGGAMIPGAMIYSVYGPGVIMLSNGGIIPDVYESSDNFGVYWTTNGENPSDPAAPGRQSAGAFSGGFAGEALDFSLPRWGGQTDFPVTMYAKSENGILFESSAVVTQTIAINEMDLRAPQVSAAEGLVTLSLVTALGDMPDGARIYYTTDGTDPGDDGTGNPVAGVLYSGPFEASADPCLGATVMAKVYAPTGVEHWFNVSPTASMVAPPLSATDSFFATVCRAREFCGYTWFVTGGTAKISGAGTTVEGDMAIGPNGKIGAGQSKVKGRIVKHEPKGGGGGGGGGPTGSNFSNSSTILMADATDEYANSATSTGVVTTEDLISAAEEALAFALEFTEMTPTQTVGMITTSKTIYSTGPKGVNIVSVAGIALDGHNKLTLNGGPDDWFVLNVSNKFEWSGHSKLILSGGVTPDRVLVNVLPSVDLVSMTGQMDSFPATLVALSSDIYISGGSDIQGSIISGGDSQEIAGGSSLSGDATFGGCP